MISQISNTLKMVVFVTTIFFILNPLAGGEYLSEKNGMWIIRHNIQTKASIDRVIGNLEKMRIKNAYVQIRGRGYSYYNSGIEPKAPGIEKGLDPLKYFIEQAAKKNIHVHAWINTYLLWTSVTGPTNKNHLYYKHPDWFDGIVDQPENNLIRHTYLSPLCLKANLYLLALVEEIVDHYNVDGIHLDYIRYFNETAGNHSEGFEEFTEKYKLGPDDDRYAEKWVEYKASKVDELVSDISELINLQQFPVLLSAAVKPNPTNAYYSYGQNWLKWLSEGWVDHVVLMNYSKSLERFTKNLSMVQIQCDISKVYCGIGLWNKPEEIIINQMTESEKLGFKNIILFSYDSVIDKN